MGHNKEVGLNIKYDNVFADNDKFRAKINAFQNDVTNYIDLAQGFIDVTGTLTPPPLCVPTPFSYTDCFQYQNVGSARIYGFELQASYDAGPWFASVSGQHLRGENVTLGAPLATIPPNQISFVLGTRWLDKKLTVAARWTAVAAKPLNQIPTVVSDNGATLPIFDPTHSYNLVNLYTRGGSRVLGRELVERGLSQVYVLQQRVGLRCPKPWHNLQGLRDDPRGNTGGQIARNGKMQSAGD